MGRETEQAIKQILKITSPKDNLEYKLEEIKGNYGLNIGKIKIQPKYILSIGNKDNEIAPYYKLFLDENEEPSDLVLKVRGDRYSIVSPNEVQEKYQDFILKVRQIYDVSEVTSYGIDSSMRREECLN